MLERGIVSRILFPAPPASYTIDSFPHDLVWVPKGRCARLDDQSPPPLDIESVPCLLLTYPSARFLIIFFHSNAEDLGRCRGFCCYLREQFQVHVLAVEYPGYGVCPGLPSGETVMENALAGLRFATETLRWPLDSIKVFGRSIGTGPAVGLASLFSFAGVILVTPFLSVQELFRDRVGPFAGLVEEWFANEEMAPKITSPTIIIHGQRDELISCRHGEMLYELIRSRKLLVSPPEMEHNTNLLTNLQFFVLPMFQFFALPDYIFQDMHVPAWAYDKRRSPFYMSGSAGATGEAAPGDPGDVPRLPSHNAPRRIVPLLSLQSQFPAGTATEAKFTFRHEAAPDEEPDEGPQSMEDVGFEREPVPPSEAQEAIRRLEEFAGKLCASEICSDGLCALEERAERFEFGSPDRAAGRRRLEAGGASSVPPPGLLGMAIRGKSVPTCPESVWTKWCGTNRTALSVDPFEATEETDSVRARWARRRSAAQSASGGSRRSAPPAPGQAPPASVLQRGLGPLTPRGVPAAAVGTVANNGRPRLLQACCHGAHSDHLLDVPSPRHLPRKCTSPNDEELLTVKATLKTTAADEELLQLRPAAVLPRQTRCAMSI